MGGRNISITKSGKVMNPTDQARKDARKKELRKNKKQRLIVRQNVLKGKNPRSLITDMEHLDRMEYDPINPSPYNIKVLQEKRKKVKETWDRVYRLYTKDQPDAALQMDTLLGEYEKSRAQLITWFESVKETQRVTIDEIPMPELPHGPAPTLQDPPRSILKQKDVVEQPQRIMTTRKPPGPPPGRPPILSDNEDISDDDEEISSATKIVQSNDRRRIRFADPSSSLPTTPPISRWSDNIPNEYEQNEIPEFGTPVTVSQPPQLNTDRPLMMPPPFPPPPRGMRLPPPLPPASFFTANPNVRMPPSLRPPFPPNMPPLNASKPLRHQAPNVFSAPPSLIAKPSSQASMASNPVPIPTKPSMTFEAKPQIRARQDVTKFVPTVLKVKRSGTTTSASSIGTKGSDIGGLKSTSRFEDPFSMRSRGGNTSNPTNQHRLVMTGPSTDDAYDTFMKEINQLA